MLVAGILMLALVSCNNGNKEGFKNPYEKDMAWWREARYGMFIHWGIYSRGDWSESWAFHNKVVSMDDYFAQEADFTAKDYNPGSGSH